jgi:hypothetical protein
VPLSIWYELNPDDVDALEKQMRRKIHYVIKPSYLWASIAHQARIQSDELLNTLQAGFKYEDLALDETIAGYLDRYADFDFDIDYTEWKVSFRKGETPNIKISRGEQNIFIRCLFIAICERMLDGHVS